MGLIYCGVDEAGYGPMLGPLCVGLTALRVDGWREGQAAPDLWALLKPTVAKRGGGKSVRAGDAVLIDDSKRLKLAGGQGGRHPLTHLERGVLSMLACGAGARGGAGICRVDGELWDQLGVRWPLAEPWYGGAPMELPLSTDRASLTIAMNLLRGALDRAGVSVLGASCEAVSETEFNRIIAEAGTKAAATEAALGVHLRRVWNCWVVGGGEHAGDDGVRVVCDRQGGRTQYGGTLAKMLPETVVDVLEESEARSRYAVSCAGAGERGGGAGRSMIVQFMSEAESAHLPVAMASMIAKLTRELLMARFNRYWTLRMPELKPTAGYVTDARRWLRDAGVVLAPGERERMVRRA